MYVCITTIKEKEARGHEPERDQSKDRVHGRNCRGEMKNNIC